MKPNRNSAGRNKGRATSPQPAKTKHQSQNLQAQDQTQRRHGRHSVQIKTQSQRRPSEQALLPHRGRNFGSNPTILSSKGEELVKDKLGQQSTSSEDSSDVRGGNVSINVFKLPLEKEPSIISEVHKAMSPERRQSMAKELLNRSLSESSDPDHSKGAKSDIDAEELAKMIASQKIQTSPVTSPDPTPAKACSDLRPPKQVAAPQRQVQSLVIGQPSQRLKAKNLKDKVEAEYKMEDEHLRKFQKRLEARLSHSIRANSLESMRLIEQSRTSVHGHHQKKRSSAGRQPVLHTAESIANIMLRPHKERSQKNYEEMHLFMSKNIKFFKEEEKDGKNYLTLEQKMSCYEALMYKMYDKDFVLCEFGERGDRFYIIIKGKVAVYQPTEVNEAFNTTWEMLHFILKIYDKISSRAVKNSNASECIAVIDLLGAKLLKELEFRSWLQFSTFLGKVKNLDDEVFEDCPTLDRKRISENLKILTNFLTKLQSQVMRLEETSAGSISLWQDPEDQLKCKLSTMDQVATLQDGDSFGQDAILSDDTRNATCICASDKVICAVLTKSDFKRVLYELEKYKTEQKIVQIQMFQLFSHVTKRKLKNMYRDFYAPKTQEVYVATRNQYLYRQGDPISGVFCIISGQLKRIKETWHMEEAAPTKELKKVVTTLPNSRSMSPVHKEERHAAISHPKKSIGLVNEIKRNKSKQIVLTIIEAGHTVGVEEVVAKTPRYTYSLKVSSPTCAYLFLSTKNFKEHFYQGSLVMKNMLQNRIVQQSKFHHDLEAKKTSFSQLNSLSIINTEQVARVPEHELSTIEEPDPREVIKHQKSSSPAKVRELAAQNAKRNEALTRQKEAEQKVKDLQSLEDLTNSQSREVAKDRLSREIEEEMQKKRPNVKKMIVKMKERRQEKAIQQQEKVKKVNKLKNLSSNSYAGKLLESQACKQFRASYIDDGKRTFQKEENKMSIKVITEKLGKDADGISSKWKQERLHEEQVGLMLASLTSDKRIQRSLRVFTEQLSHFIVHLKEQGREYCVSMGVPSFPGSLLLDEDDRTHLQKIMVTQTDTNDSVLIKEVQLGDSLHKVDPPSMMANFGIGDSSSNAVSGRNTFQGSKCDQGSAQFSHQSTLRIPVDNLRSVSRKSVLSHHSLNYSAPKTTRLSKINSSSRANSTESQLDLMKVFFEWIQSFQKTEFMQRNRSASNTNETANRLLARAKTTAFDLYESSQKSSQIRANLYRSGSQGTQLLSKISSVISSNSGGRFSPFKLSLHNQESGLAPIPTTKNLQQTVQFEPSLGREKKLTRQIQLKIGNSVQVLNSQKTAVLDREKVTMAANTARAKCSSQLFHSRSTETNIYRTSRLLNALPRSNENLLEQMRQETIPEEDFRASLLDIPSDINTPAEGTSVEGSLHSKYQNIRIEDSSYPISSSKIQEGGKIVVQREAELTFVAQEIGQPRQQSLPATSEYYTDCNMYGRQEQRLTVAPQGQQHTSQLPNLGESHSVQLMMMKNQAFTVPVQREEDPSELNSAARSSQKAGPHQRRPKYNEDNLNYYSSHQNPSEEFLHTNQNIFSMGSHGTDSNSMQHRGRNNNVDQVVRSADASDEMNSDLLSNQVGEAGGFFTARKQQYLSSEASLAEKNDMQAQHQMSKAATAMKKSEWVVQKSAFSVDYSRTPNAVGHPATIASVGKAIQQKKQTNLFRLRLKNQNEGTAAAAAENIITQAKSVRNQWISPLEIRKKENLTNRQKASLFADIKVEMPIPPLLTESTTIDLQMSSSMPPVLQSKVSYKPQKKLANYQRNRNRNSESGRHSMVVSHLNDKTGSGSLFSFSSAQFIPRIKTLVGSKTDSKSLYTSNEKFRPTTADTMLTPATATDQAQDNCRVLGRQSTYDHLLPRFVQTPGTASPRVISSLQTAGYLPGANFQCSPMIIQTAGGQKNPVNAATRQQSMAFAPQQAKRKPQMKRINASSVKKLKVESKEYLRFTDRVIQDQNLKAMLQKNFNAIQGSNFPQMDSQNDCYGKTALRMTKQARIHGSKYTQATFGPNHYSTVQPETIGKTKQSQVGTPLPSEFTSPKKARQPSAYHDKISSATHNSNAPIEMLAQY